MDKTPHTAADRLVATAAELLCERGFHGSGLTEILSTSAVPKGSLYHHFPGGKSQLAAEAVRRSAAGSVAALERFADRAGTVGQAVRAFCERYADDLTASDFRRGCPLAAVAAESGALPEDVRQSIGEAMDLLIATFTRRVRAESPAHPAPRELAVEIVAAIEGALLLAKSLRSTEPLTIIGERLTERMASELHP
ncbi:MULTISPECIES: TetR/AcrR family transcriptional regulator [unclassified Streptomyces]|uniref:TetR/AcrR family transcriptional regulator n=1 Tax=unclassified Streptomyces TaxID=2593676 RepID=UPI0022B6DDA1|nr:MULTISPECIES: TetR/AcrR family transcriptional regulator [unclassified Streptomyces]MCZ7413201.1 TetR/AcrR family transcriptional regulator [Streptomyces sp. WMMC897]MCZ7430194.1 TetR/AcrR family transcriptional regulator [Streptomyces sp. WMMC1477]